jgi:isoquinoline 1-oxidoreductase alpha subunit
MEAPMAVTFTVNGRTETLDLPSEMPLLWALRDGLNLTGTKFGCGVALCGACTTHINGQPMRSCITPVSAATGKRITTIEAIGATSAGKRVQAAWLALEVPQCGYCQSGQAMSASALLAAKAKPSDSDIDDAMAGRMLPPSTVVRHHTKTARSQIIGGTAMGLGMALLEETVLDRTGRLATTSPAEYVVPVNADVRNVDVLFVGQPDSNDPAWDEGHWGSPSHEWRPRSRTRSITRRAHGSACVHQPAHQFADRRDRPERPREPRGRLN